ncbi:hypothetical protein AHMF7605_26750 [Adhaeribacter arboris]|uniref:DUF4595 domain-containing protein n=1 Tax=Adhaeribacter arboris TaxID=2072846 RepID=A0A2T2YMW4_9BACT|nr:hypothetical protein [Adhaeribacter arboris]PSR56841.1 hypothetical protein AHMF7605_26750 [Adhaeribacter arboris]
MRRTITITQLTLSIFLSLLFFSACNTDNGVDPAPAPAPDTFVVVLSKVIFAGSDTIRYQYNAQKLLVKARYSAERTPTANRYYREYAYDGIGRLTKSHFKLINGNELSYLTYTYTNDRLTKISYYNRPQPQEEFKHEYDNVLEYNNQNRITKLITYHPELPITVHRYTEYTYDATGNVIKLMDYVNSESGPVNDYTVEYTYDTKYNPYQNAIQIGIGAEILSNNNILQQKESYPLSGQTKITTHTYTYNELGLPVKDTRKSDTTTLEVVNEYKYL